jgi:hypothetical protein
MSTTPAGWYSNPENAAQLRYWDGSQWTHHTAAAAQLAASGTATANPYDAHFNVAALPEEQRQEYMRHELKSFPSWAVVVLSIVTFGIFGTIYHGLKHSKLPKVRDDDFGALKGLGFLLIPFFNLYWVFVFWLRLVDRINFQHRLRGGAPPINRDLALWTVILTIASFIIPFAGLASSIMALIVAAQIQTAANQLAREEVHTHAVIPATAPQAAPPPPSAAGGGEAPPPPPPPSDQSSRS